MKEKEPLQVTYKRPNGDEASEPMIAAFFRKGRRAGEFTEWYLAGEHLNGLPFIVRLVDLIQINDKRFL